MLIMDGKRQEPKTVAKVVTVPGGGRGGKGREDIRTHKHNSMVRIIIIIIIASLHSIIRSRFGIILQHLYTRAYPIGRHGIIL